MAVARALINDPDVLIADEPTGNLDKRTGETVFRLIWELKEATGKTLILATHDPSLAVRGDRIFRMIDGKIEPLSQEEIDAYLPQREVRSKGGG